MKKILAFFVAVCLCVAIVPMSFANGNETTVVSVQTYDLGDGASVIVTVEEENMPALREVFTKHGSKNYTYILNNTVQWKFTVYGSFSINRGTSVSCYASSYGFSESVSGWSLESGSSSYSGSSATASGTVTGIRTVYPSVSISCDKNGNLL